MRRAGAHRGGELPAAPAALVATGCGGTPPVEVADTAQTVIGERRFRDTPFARFHSDGNAGRRVNAPLVAGDPALEATETPDGPLPEPYAGLAMNRAACHLVDDDRAALLAFLRALNEDFE